MCLLGFDPRYHTLFCEHVLCICTTGFADCLGCRDSCISPGVLFFQHGHSMHAFHCDGGHLCGNLRAVQHAICASTHALASVVCGSIWQVPTAGLTT
jgi:hypothetical protein